MKIENKEQREYNLIIEKWINEETGKKYWSIYLPHTVKKSNSWITGDEVKRCVIFQKGKQKVNDELEICIDGNRGTGLSTSEKFLYFEFNYKEGKIKHRCERYRLTEHPRFENFFLVGDIGKKNAESLLEICATCSISGRYGRPRPREWFEFHEDGGIQN